MTFIFDSEPDGLSGGGADKPEAPLTRLQLKKAGVVNEGWQYELPLDIPPKIEVHDIVCGTDPVNGGPDTSVRYLVRSIDENGFFVAMNLDQDKEEQVTLDPATVFKIASAFESDT